MNQRGLILNLNLNMYCDLDQITQTLQVSVS